MPTDRLDLLATCTFGLEAVVVRELEQLGYDAKPVATGRVAFVGDWRAVCEANLWLRAADRVLIRVGAMDVGGGDRGFDQLFDGVKALPWERFIARDAAFPVAGRAVRSAITSEPAIQRATKRAVVERLRTAYASEGVGALLPETAPKVQIEVALVDNVATLTIDTTGPGLHKRGYREHRAAVDPAAATGAGEAALRETLAAGLVLLSVWRPAGGRVLLDPFCGSGTIAIEAALLERSIAPGLNRTFDCEAWLSPAASSAAQRQRLIPPDLWAEVRDEAREAITPSAKSPRIFGSDIDDRALALARANARAAGVEADIIFTRADARELTGPHNPARHQYGVIVTNPPYGVRVGADGRPGVGIDREVDRLYRALPIVFRRLPTWSFHILTAVLELETLFAQPASRRRKLYNSTIECTYFTFLGPRPPASRPGGAGGPSVIASDEAGTPPDSAPVEEGIAPAFAPAFVSDAASPPSETDDVAPALPPPASTPAPTFGGLRDRDLRELDDFARCLANNLRHLRKYPSRGVTCYRVYERDVTDVPLIIDRYADRYHVAEYEREHSRTAAQQADWFDRVRAIIAAAAEVPPEHIYVKEKHRQRGLTQHEKVADARRTHIVLEGADDTFPALKFEINLSDYIDTGLFLDHRLTRRMVRAEAAGKRFLNLFCYTGSFTVYAMQGGAASTTSVDLSNTYLAWARRNLELNTPSLDPRQHRGVCDDVLAFLASHPVGHHYDLAVVDPPTFSNSKSLEADWEVGSQYLDVLRHLRALMPPAGVVYFSNNFRKFKFDADAVAALGWSARDISSQTVPPEYRNRKVHRCWRLTDAR